MRVLTQQDRLAAAVWPELTSQERVLAPLGISDTLVLCAGFEDRVTGFLGQALAAGSRKFSVVCVDYLPLISGNRKNEVREHCERARCDLRLVVYDRESPAGAAQQIFDAVPDGTVIHMDLSGMSRLLIVQLIVHAIQARVAGHIQLWYTEAQEYPPTQEEVQARASVDSDPLGVAMFLSSSVFGVTAVPELSSVAMHGQPIRLVAFPSWNSMQIAALCAEVQASSYTMIHGQPPRSEYSWRPQAIRALYNIEALPSLEERTTSTLDYRETLRVLVDVYRTHAQQEKLVLSPTGSKMQAVAVAIMRGWFHDLQVLYPTPRSFAAPSEYTRGVRLIHSLPLAPFALPASDDAPSPESEASM